MLALPPVAQSVGRRSSLRPPRDYSVRVDSNDCSVHPAVIGRKFEISADLDTVTVRCVGRVVAVLERCWARHQSITDPEHRAAAEVLQRAPRERPPVEHDVQHRSLSDYDAVFGLTEDVAWCPPPRKRPRGTSPRRWRL